MREGLCVHWKGIIPRPGEMMCGAGVDVAERDGGPLLGVMQRLPCMARNGNPRFECANRRFPTPDEVAKSEVEFKEYASAVIAVMGAIGKQPKGGSGTVPCPRCKGTIRWRASLYNGHKHAACETPDCLQVME